MPFNGSGTFISLAPPDFPALPFTTILASMFNANLNDIFTNGLTNCLTRDGQSVPFTNLPMGGFKFTNMGFGSADTDSAALGQGLNNRGQVGVVNWDTRTQTGLYEAVASNLTSPAVNFPPTSEVGQLVVTAQGSNIVQSYITGIDMLQRKRISGVWSAWVGMNSTKLGVGRNLLINGNFDCWDYATSQTTSGYGSANRWVMANLGTTKTASRVAYGLGNSGAGVIPNNTKYLCRHVVSSVAGAGNFCAMEQYIESVLTAQGQTVTVSFVGFMSSGGSADVAVNFYQTFGTGGSPSATVQTAGQRVTLTPIVQRFSLQFAIPSITGKTLGTDDNDVLALRIWFDAGSSFNSQTNSLGQQSGTFNISNVQVEIGAFATPFEIRSVAQTQQECARYYATGLYLFTGTVTSGTGYTTAIGFPATMRRIPAMSFTSTLATNFGTATTGFSSSRVGTYPQRVATGSGNGSYGGVWTADAELP